MVGFFLFQVLWGKTARRTEARRTGFRCRSLDDLGPDGLARRPPRRGAPAVGEGLDEEEASTGLGLGSEGGALGSGEPFTARVRHLDAESDADDVHRQVEVAPLNPSVRRRVGRQLGDDVPRRVQRQLP